jgi:DNA-binding NarL/FixJ family response regulator
MNASKIGIVERAYALGQSHSQWLDDISDTLRANLDSIVSAFAFEVCRVEGQTRLGEHWVEDPEVAEYLQRTFLELPQPMLELLFSEPLIAATCREFLTRAGTPFPEKVLGEMFAELGAADVFSLGGYDPMGNGVCLGMLIESPAGPPLPERAAWSQVAAHVAAGFRLRARLGDTAAIDEADAVMRTDGKLEHLVNEAEFDRRELLGEAVRRIERARLRGCDEDEALTLWQGLVAGEWSLVDHFEGAARRYYVAVRNPPGRARTQALTPREAEVVAYVACGTGTKAIAYALGIDGATVRRYLHNAMTKLGLSTRTELIMLRSTLLGG